jgi:branched-chain amino acid transport system ATP-binding protein
MSDLLQLDNIAAGYGEAQVLQNISFSLKEGEALALLGRNGTGKTTLINTIIGLTRLRAGAIHLAGADITKLRADQRAMAGIGWVPQERNIFRSLTVEENITAVATKGPWTLERIYQMFPRLAERKRNLGTQLSGGEQQMLAVGRGLALNPRVLLLDEPLEGLAPIIVDELLAAIRRIVVEERMAAIIVEQSARKILPLTERAIILDRGTIVHQGPSAELAEDAVRLANIMGIAGSPGAH